MAVAGGDCEIRIKGRLSDSVLAAFEGLRTTVLPVETVLYGPVQDQAALYGLLDRIQSLGLELVEVRQLPASADQVPAEPEPQPPDPQAGGVRPGSGPEGTVASPATRRSSETAGMRRRTRQAPLPRSAFAGFRFPCDVIVLAVRWYLRFGLSYRDVEEPLAERGVEVDHVTVYRWVQRFTPLLADATRPCRHAVGDRWQVDETYVKVAGQWRYVYRAIDQFGQVVDVFVSRQRDAAAAHRFFQRAIGATKVSPVEVTTDQAPVYPAVLEERLPAAWHRTDRCANNRIECDHGRLKARLRPMRGLKQDRSARVVIAGHALVQNIRRGHYELAVEEPTNRRLAVAFKELILAI